MSVHLEKIFFHSIINRNDYIEVTNPRFFEDKTFKTLFPIVKEFWDKYREAPSLNQIKELVNIKNLSDEISKGQLESIWEIDMSQYDDEWIKENTETWIEYKNLDLSAVDLVKYLKTTDVNVENIKEVVDKCKSIILERNNLNFSFSEGSDFFNADTHEQPTYLTFSSGFPFIDLVAGGGFSAKTLTVFIGAAKVGKSIWMGNIACEAVRSGHNVAVISLEMSEAKYIKRMGANLLSMNIKDYDKAALDKEMMKKKLKSVGMDNLKVPGKLMVKEFPTSCASTIEIENYLLKMEEKLGIKFKVVIIDYLNIMKNWRNPNTENTYMKIKQIAEDVRAMAQRNSWAVISATQVKQSSFDTTDLTMGSVAESSGLVATVDLMFGIIQDSEMYTANKYKLKCLANRNEGLKNASKRYDINYSYMKIKEDPTSEIQEGDGDYT